jgi:hypothetical protein
MNLTVPAGTELHQCQFAVMPNATDVDAVSFAHHYTLGSHHFLVIGTDLDAVPSDMPGQYDCTNGDEPIMQHARGVLYGGQTPDGTFPLPSGVGFPFKAHQVLILQAHYLNAGAQPVDATIEFGVDVAAPGSIQQTAGYMFFYDPFVYVPAEGKGSTGLGCAVPSAVNLISASTHYHQRGTGMKVYNDVGGVAAATPFFETHDWEHPPDFHGPLALPAGSRVRFVCDYQSTDPVDVFEGPNAKTSEMCVLGGLYFPKQDAAFENCEEQSIVGGGTKACNDLLSCAEACLGDDKLTDPCWQKCIASGCGGAADTLLPLVGCIKSKCATECAAGQSSACATSQCGAPHQACVAHVCSM